MAHQFNLVGHLFVMPLLANYKSTGFKLIFAQRGKKPIYEPEIF